MGYQYGTWETHFRNPRLDIPLTYIHHLIRRNKIGNFVWNNIHVQYKSKLYETDSIIINDAIDNAFMALKYINYIMKVYKSKQKRLT